MEFILNMNRSIESLTGFSGEVFTGEPATKRFLSKMSHRYSDPTDDAFKNGGPTPDQLDKAIGNRYQADKQKKGIPETEAKADRDDYRNLLSTKPQLVPPES
jgi:hypothetical protein